MTKRPTPAWMRRYKLGLCTHCGLDLKGREAYAVDNTGTSYVTATCNTCTALGCALVVKL